MHVLGFLVGFAFAMGVYFTIKRRRIGSPIIWTGLAGGLVVGLSLSLFADEGYIIDTAHTLGIIFGTLGGGIGYFTDMLVEDGKKAAAK